MEYENEVTLWEDTIERDATGALRHHPLNSIYDMDNQYGTSYGHLTFCGHDLAQAPAVQAARVFYLEFQGPPANAVIREEWANPLRLEVLQRLCPPSYGWYLGFMAEAPPPGSPLAHLPWAAVQSEKRAIYGAGFMPRLLIETPLAQLPLVFAHYWPDHMAGHPIEGYCLPAGHTPLLRAWDQRPRDAALFREVLDLAWLMFYTMPAENRDLVFVTTKLDLAALRQHLNVEVLQQKARQLPSDRVTPKIPAQ